MSDKFETWWVIKYTMHVKHALHNKQLQTVLERSGQTSEQRAQCMRIIF